MEEGLNKNNAEIQCIPTFILPKATDVKGKALVLDLGGTNYRVAIVDFSTEKPIIYPNNGWKKDMSIMKSPGYTREELFKELADLIVEIKVGIHCISALFLFNPSSTFSRNACAIPFSCSLSSLKIFFSMILILCMDYLCICK